MRCRLRKTGGNSAVLRVVQAETASVSLFLE